MSSTETTEPTQATQTTPTDRKPLLAAAGAADAAVAALRELPAKVTEAVNDEELRAEFRARFADLPADVKAFREGLPELLLSAQAKAADLPQKVRELLAEAGREAGKAYEGFATRGEGVVTKLRAEYGPTVENAVANVRGKVADAADEVAGITEKAASDLKTKR
ncbi:hypothetical protein E1212_27420 [Jiangella ureilytica]|uniref:Heparin-binding hemagglutinin n=1 Tax=Jiangella ureilytica TaxID=2530374 RepID=A0A4V2XVQ2_9ACTN|nr:hypothetical protein [Jiangella ureilytica]TDC46215.1 hypothetical protein E1212_27420 [Jiangella ureilytica]